MEQEQLRQPFRQDWAPVLQQCPPSFTSDLNLRSLAELLSVDASDRDVDNLHLHSLEAVEQTKLFSEHSFRGPN